MVPVGLLSNKTNVPVLLPFLLLFQEKWRQCIFFYFEKNISVSSFLAYPCLLYAFHGECRFFCP